MTTIQWTEATWNPVVGCSPVSEGCRNCYAAKEAIRLAGNPNEKIASAYAGTAEMRGLGAKRRAVFTGRVNLLPDRLEQPLRWRKPRRVFVNSMSDLFHEAVPFEFVAEVFRVMRLADQHTYQILTKRPERAAEFAAWAQSRSVLEGLDFGSGPIAWARAHPNIWIGTSVEDQAAADERIPHLLEIPAAVRFLSCEPLLGQVDLSSWIGNPPICGPGSERAWLPDEAGVDWVIVGGESGPGARPCDVAWIRSIVEQCKSAGMPAFVKQLGQKAVAYDPEHQWFDGRDFHTGGRTYLNLTDRKGGDPSEWPKDLRVREYPIASEAP